MLLMIRDLFLQVRTALLCLIFLACALQIFAQEKQIKRKFRVEEPQLLELDSLFQIAKENLLDGKTEVASRYLKRVINGYGQAAEVYKAEKNWEQSAFALTRRAEAERRIYEPDSAISTLGEARVILENHVNPESFVWFRYYFVYGELFHRITEYYKASTYLDSAQLIYDKVNSYDSANYSTLIDFKFYAYLYADKNLDTLEKYADQRLELEEYRQQQNRYFDPETILFIKEDYYTMYEQTGEYFLALVYAISNYKYALQNEEQIKTNYEQTYERAILDLGNALYNIQELGLAERIAQRARERLQRTKPTSDAFYSINFLLGDIYSAKNDPSKAIEYYASGLEIEKQFIQQTYLEVEEAQARMKTGVNLLKLGQAKEALEQLNVSLTQMKELVESPNPQLLLNYENIADYYQNFEDYPKALNFYDTALYNADLEIFEIEGEFPKSDSTYRFSLKSLDLLKKKALALKKVSYENMESKNLRLLDFIDRTHQELTRNRQEIYQSDGKLFLSQFFKSIYETGIEACFELYQATNDVKYAKKAHDYMRLSKANLLQEQSKDYDELTVSGVPYELKEEFYEKSLAVEQLKSQLLEFLEISATSDSVLEVNDRLLNLQSEITMLKDSIARNYAPDSRKTDDESIIDELADGDFLLEYFYGDDYIYSISVDQDDQYYLQRVELSDKFSSQISSFISMISSAPNPNEMEDQLIRFKELSSYLYENLLSEHLANKDIERLNLILDDLLTRIPFEVLIQSEEGHNFKELDYLIKETSIQYLFTSNKQPFHETDIVNNDRILGMGYTSINEGAATDALPGTEKEIQYLNANFSGEFYTGVRASRELFLDKADQFEIIHLAIHGRADEENRFQSRLIFNGDQEDNMLYPGQLYLANLKSRLAVLSACESGVGTIQKGEGTFSIARGFAIVGIPNIIMSLWEVNDAITSRQMVRFYNSHLQKGTPVNQALRKMKIEYLQNEDSYFCHPYYWSSFVHISTDLEEGKAQNYMTYVILLVSAMLFMTIFLVAKKRKGI